MSMSGMKPDIKLVAFKTFQRDLDGLSRIQASKASPSNQSPDQPRTNRSSPQSSSDSDGDSESESDSSISNDSSSISSDNESGHGTDPEARLSMRTPTFYKSAQWTADGTTVITSSYQNQICSFVVPSDLLEPREQPLTLRPQSVLKLATSTNVVAPAPYFDLSNPHTHHVLVACHNHPIQIFQALPTNLSTNDARHRDASNGVSSLYSYQLISPQTEAYLPVNSLVWPGSYMSNSFFVGSNNLIAQFDLHRIGEGPRQRIHTIPSKRHISKGNGVGMRGTVSALSMQTDENSMPTGLLAGGTWTRWVGLYDFARGGERTATWSMAKAAESVVVEDPPPGLDQPPRHRHNSRGRTPIKGIGGEGINQTVWSPDGRYLLINERQSTGMLIYDVRVTNKVFGFLAGRDALTHQRLDLTVYPGSEDTGGFEVWAGTRDGIVKVWQGVGNKEGCLWPSWDFTAMAGTSTDGEVGGSPVGSVALHSSGSVAATCNGRWSIPGGDDTNSYSSSSSSSDDDSDDGKSDSTASSTGSTSKRSIWRPDNKIIEGSSLKLWTIGASPHESVPDTLPGDMTEMDVSEVDAPEVRMPEVNVTQMDTSQEAVQNDVSQHGALQMNTPQADAIKASSIEYSDFQVATEVSQDDALQTAILQMSIPETR